MSLSARHFNRPFKLRSTTFAQLKPRLINVLMNALQVETDAQNTHMLLGGLLLCVQDSAIFEENETNTELYQSSPAPSDANLLSSGKYNSVVFIVNFFEENFFANSNSVIKNYSNSKSRYAHLNF